MANSFSKQEIVAFEKVFEAFNDGLVVSKLFGAYNVDNTVAERAGNTVWRPMPYIAQSFTGIDQSANFNRNYTQLSVPTTLGYSHSVPLTLSATELRDLLQKERLGQAALQRLASDINVDCSNLAALTGTVVSKRTAAASGFDDVAALDTAFNRLGVPMDSRLAMYSSGDYNSMASGLASRVLDNKKSLDALEKAYVGNLAGFDTYKLDYAYRLTAAAGVTVTINGANQRYVPKATSTASTGEVSNVDNRYQVITIAVTSGTVKVGDCFTIAGVNEVHHVTKADTGNLKTFRVTAIVTGSGGSGTVQISPPIIAADSSPTDPELQYKNVTATPANGAAITWLNTVSASVNPFWQADCFEIMPGQYVPDDNSSLPTLRAATDQGVTVLMSRQGAIGDLSTKYRWDVFYGLVNKQPQMSGIQLFSQT
jgi:P22 coat protein - gene protein 5